MISGGSARSLNVPLSIAQKEGQKYIRTSFNSHSVCFSFMRENGLYFYEYDSNDSLEKGVYKEENGELYACGEKFGEYTSAYLDLGSVCFQKNTNSDFDSIAFYQTWIQEHIENFLGICETGTFTKTMQGAQVGWCDQEGIIIAYCADFNNEGQEECLVVSIEDENNVKILHITILSADENREVKQQDIRITGIDTSLSNDTRIYVTKGKTDRNIIIQSFHSMNGCSSNIYILTVTSNGEFFLNDWICDPGDSSSISLYSRWALDKDVNRIYDIDWEEWQSILRYQNVVATDCARDSIYGDSLNKVLENYDLHASVSETMFGKSMWLLDEDDKILKIAQIYGKFSDESGAYKNDYGVFKCSDLKNTSETTYLSEILPDSDIRYLSRDELLDMPLQVLNYAKNEIYARKGRKFRSIELQQYFDSKSWYCGTIEAEDFNDALLNDFERTNAQLLSDIEHEVNSNGYQLDQLGYSYNAVYDYLSAK